MYTEYEHHIIAKTTHIAFICTDVIYTLHTKIVFVKGLSHGDSVEYRRPKSDIFTFTFHITYKLHKNTVQSQLECISPIILVLIIIEYTRR